MKQGHNKHKKSPIADMMEGADYNRKLDLMLKMSLVESTLAEASFRDKPGFGSAYAQAARKSTFGNIGAGAMRDPSDPVRVKADRAIANRERGLASQGKYYGAKMAAAKAASPAPAPDVEKMKAELANLVIRFNDLGGDSYRYADRMTDRDREAEAVHRSIRMLQSAIQRAEQGVAENAEYDDEAGMADNNIETMKRAIQGLDNLIQSGDNLPEWCQEKIAVSKSMLVAVWDYMASEEQSTNKK